MPVFRGSRYEGAFVTEIQLDSGERRPYVHDRNRFTPRHIRAGSRAVNFVSGSSFDLMAHEAYGDGRKYWIIADVNNVLFPEVDEEDINADFVGRVFAIPPLELLNL